MQRSMQGVSCYEHSFFFWALCLYFKTLGFSFSSPFLWWLVKVVPQAPTYSFRARGPTPAWSQPSPWQGSDGKSDWVSIPRSLSLPGCCYLSSRIYRYSGQQQTVVSAFCPPRLPDRLLAEPPGSSPCVQAAAAAAAAAQQLKFLFPSLRRSEAFNETSAPPPYQPAALWGAGRGKWKQK